jgi:hypothetical protein
MVHSYKVGVQRFSLTLVAEIQGAQLIRLDPPHSLASVWIRGEKNTHVRSLASSSMVVHHMHE